LVTAYAIDFHAINVNSVKMRKNAVAVNKVELCSPATPATFCCNNSENDDGFDVPLQMETFPYIMPQLVWL